MTHDDLDQVEFADVIFAVDSIPAIFAIAIFIGTFASTLWFHSNS